MKLRPWLLLCLAALPAGCGAPHDVGGKTALGHVVDAQEKKGDSAERKFVWGPEAPEPPLMPSPVPPMPENGTVQNPGDGRKAEDRLVPSTANPATPK